MPDVFPGSQIKGREGRRDLLKVHPVDQVGVAPLGSGKMSHLGVEGRSVRVDKNSFRGGRANGPDAIGIDIGFLNDKRRGVAAKKLIILCRVIVQG